MDSEDFFPTISLKDYFAGSTDGLRRTADAVDRALTDAGAFFLVDFGFDPSLADRLLEDMSRFFALPPETKRLYESARKNEGRGYVPFAVQNANAFMGRQGLPNDAMERFHFGPPRPLVRGFVQEPTDFMESWAPNIYSAEPETFRRSVVEYFEAANELSVHMMTILSAAMGQPSDFLWKLCDHASPMFKVNHYPVCEPEPAQDRIAEHTDCLPFTLILQDRNRDALAIRTARGDWRFANSPPGALVVLTGDCAAQMTNDRWPAAPHKVPFPPDPTRMTARLAALFFVQMNPEARIETLPDFLDGDRSAAPKYPPTTFRAMMEHKMEGLVRAGKSY